MPDQPDFQTELQPVDYDSMTDEQLDEAFRKETEGFEPVPGVHDPPEEPAAPENGKAEAPVEEPKAEPEAEQAAEAPKDDQQPEKADEPELEFDEQASRFEDLQLQLREEIALRKHAERLQGNASGQLGELKKTIRRLQSDFQSFRSGEQPEPAADSLPSAEPREAAPKTRPTDIPPAESWQAELWEESQQRAVIGAVQDFARENGLLDDAGNVKPDAEPILQKMTPRVMERVNEYSTMEFAPKTRRNLVGDLLEVAYARVMREINAENRRAWQEKKASQVDESRKLKQAATISGSGTPAPKKQPKSYEDMTAEEADAEMIRMYGDSRARRRR